MTEFLDVPEGRIAYDVTGDGPLVVCVHGMGDLRTVYRFLVPKLAASGYRVATMDMRGCGESSTGWPTHAQTAIAADILALIRHLGGPAVVIGQSYSPDSAIVVAVEAPDEVNGIVLMAPWARRPKPNAVMAVVFRLVVTFPGLWTAFYKSLNAGDKPVDFGDYLKTLKATMRQPGRMAALAAMADPASVDAASYRTRLKTPALIVMGAEDPDFKDPAAEAATMRSDLGVPADIVMIENAGHYPNAQTPDATADAVLAFLKAHA